MAWVKTQNGDFIDAGSFRLDKVKGQPPKIVDGAGNKLGVYRKVATAKAVMEDLERWLSGSGKSIYGGHKRLFSFPKD